MARSRKRVTYMAEWTNETLEMSIRARRNGGTTRADATSLNVPTSTLQEGIYRGKIGDSKLWKNSVFTPELGESTA
jgi:hypothetical protein